MSSVGNTLTKDQVLHTGPWFIYTYDLHTAAITGKLDFYVCVEVRYVHLCVSVCMLCPQGGPLLHLCLCFFEAGCLTEPRAGGFFV